MSTTCNCLFMVNDNPECPSHGILALFREDEPILSHAEAAEIIASAPGQIAPIATAITDAEIAEAERLAEGPAWFVDGLSGRIILDSGEEYTPEEDEVLIAHFGLHEDALSAVRARALLPRLTAAYRNASATLTALGHADDSKPLATRIREAREETVAHLHAARDDLRLTADALQREIEHVTVLQDDLDRARAVNAQAETVMRQNAEMLAAMERSSDPAMRQLATEIRRRT